MNKLIMLPLVAGAMFWSCGCSMPEENKKDDGKPSEEQTPPVEDKDLAKTWTTSFDKSYDLKTASLEYGKAASMSPKIVRFTDETYQTVDGFGLAVTQASCYNLLKMSADDRTKVLKELFSPTEGAGSSLIRVCIGGSDFSMDEFTCCDTKGIENFAIHQLDKDYLFPVLDEIYAINPDVQIIGSPWSCPRWMKMNVDGTGAYNSWTSGRLNPLYYDDYATYFVKWIQAMEARGYKIKAVTLQNEPLNHGNSMSLYMPWQDQRDFLAVIGPAFEKAGITTEIILFDHNYNYDGQGDQYRYPVQIYGTPAGKYAAGSGWHNYGGSVSELDAIYSAYPDKGIWFTEASIGTWNYDYNKFGGQFDEDMREIFFGTLKRGGKGVTLWNMMLDVDSKPYRPGGCSTCYGALNIGKSYTYGSVEKYSHWYDVVHCSLVVKPGAVRIGTSGYTAKGVTYLAFRNPDGSYGVLFLNEGSSEEQFVFAGSARSVTLSVPAKSVVSLLWTDK